MTELVFRAAKRLQVATVLVANQRLQPPSGNALVTAVRVDGGADVADQYIAQHAEPGDLVVTQDIPLAALLVPRKVVVLDLKHAFAAALDRAPHSPPPGELSRSHRLVRQWVVWMVS